MACIGDIRTGTTSGSLTVDCADGPAADSAPTIPMQTQGQVATGNVVDLASRFAALQKTIGPQSTPPISAIHGNGPNVAKLREAMMRVLVTAMAIPSNRNDA